MNTSTAPTLPLFQAFSWNLRTRALGLSSTDTVVYSSSLPTRVSLLGRHHEHDANRRSPSHCRQAYSPNGVEGAFSELSCRRFSEVRQESFKDQPFGVAPLLAMLLHRVQPLRTGAWAREYKRCTSYRSNIESGLSKRQRLLWRNSYESNCIHKIWTTRAS